MSPRSHRSLAVLALLLAAAVPGAAQKVAPGAIGNLDVRYTSPSEVRRAAPVSDAEVRTVVTRVASMRAAASALQSRVPGAEVRFSQVTAAPEIVAAGNRPLTAAAPGKPGIDIVREFLRANSALYGLDAAEIDGPHGTGAGLVFVGESVSPRSGIRMVRLEQRVDGMKVFGSDTRFILDRDGRLWRSIGELVPGAATSVTRAASRSAAESLVDAMQGVGVPLAAGAISATQRPDGKLSLRVAGPTPIAGEVVSEQLLFPVRPGALVPAWRHIVFTEGSADWNVVADAGTGAVLFRKNMRADVSTQQARFSVYVQADGKTPADSPAPHSPTTVVPSSGTQFPEIARTNVNMLTVQDLAASINGWIDDGGTTTTGNNVDACADRVGGGAETNACDIGTIDNNGRPVGNPDANTNNRDFLGAAPRDYSYAPAPLAGNPDAGDTPTGAAEVNFRRGATTQLFYIANWYHDQLFQLGFDEAAGNFQNTNFSGMGLGGDRVAADVQDSSGTNNANFATPPDGQPGRMQMFRFTSPNPDRDGDLDAEIVIHELTHGLSNRLIGNADGLIWSVGRGMGEGWSDFYALSLLNNTNADTPSSSYASGAYATYQLGGLTDNYLYGIRRFPYSTNNSVNPLTWADVDDITADMSGGIAPSPLGFEGNGGFEVHNSGEVWMLSLWELRARIIADPAGANGDVPTGNLKALQIVTDAMKMTPSNPSFVDARDALIAADCAANTCNNEQWIWEAFADRGLGYGAVAPLGQTGFGNLGHIAVGESFDLPHLDFVSVNIADDVYGNNNGAIEIGEPVHLDVRMKNPWQDGSKNVPAGSATLSTSTPGVTIFDNTAAYPQIIVDTQSSSSDEFLVLINGNCGARATFTVTHDNGDSFDFDVRLGTPSGTGAPVTYTDNSVALAIPDGDPVGVFDTKVIPDDFEIADLDFRVDDLTHTFTGDLTVMVKGPTGYGAEVIWLREILFGGGDGDNFVNTVIDDESVNDLNQSFDTDAPYTGDWAPAFNSPVWALFGDPAIFADPVGQLSRFDGSSSLGTWTVHVADNFLLDSGTLNSWSLIVTPRAFACAPFVGAPVVSATKTVSGTFNVGGTVTYIVTLTNTGSAAQPDNAGNEFIDTLPAGLTAISAIASSGTAGIVGNTVSWNGSVPFPAGSVTITITATINAGTGGQGISNQGTAAFDADGNDSNETNVLTDDPGTAAPLDPTSFTVNGTPLVTGDKTVSPTSAAEGDNVTYTIVLSNTGSGAQADNAGNELIDVLAPSLTLVSAVATSGTANANTGINTVTWNGSIPVAGSVTITIVATVNAGTAGSTIDNQATFQFDADGDGDNDTFGSTDDPAAGTQGIDPTSLSVITQASVVEVPTVSELGLAALALALASLAVAVLRRRRTA